MKCCHGPRSLLNSTWVVADPRILRSEPFILIFHQKIYFILMIYSYHYLYFIFSIKVFEEKSFDFGFYMQCEIKKTTLGPAYNEQLNF